MPRFPTAEKPVKFGVFLVCKNDSLVIFRQNILPCDSACATGPFINTAFVIAVIFRGRSPGRGNHLLIPFTTELRKRGSLPAKFRLKLFGKFRVSKTHCEVGPAEGLGSGFISEPTGNFGCWKLVACLFTMGIDDDSVTDSLPQGIIFNCSF